MFDAIFGGMFGGYSHVERRMEADRERDSIMRAAIRFRRAYAEASRLRYDGDDGIALERSREAIARRNTLGALLLDAAVHGTDEITILKNSNLFGEERSDFTDVKDQIVHVTGWPETYTQADAIRFLERLRPHVHALVLRVALPAPAPAKSEL